MLVRSPVARSCVAARRIGAHQCDTLRPMLCSSSSSVPPEIGPFSTGGTIGSLGAARWLQASLPAAQKPAWLLLAPWDDEASRSRFVRRASRWTRLSHPGAMKLFDFDADPSYGFYLAFDAQEAISSEAYLKTEGQMAPVLVLRC